MRRPILPLAVALALIGGSACAMSPAQSQGWNCTVENAAKLPPEIGGVDAVCAAMKNAAVEAAGPAILETDTVSVRVTVESKNRLSALATVNGKQLPEQKLAISDRVLSIRSIEMLAKTVADQLAKSAR